MSSWCVPGKSLLLLHLWRLSRVKSFLSPGDCESRFCIHSAVTPAPPQHQTSHLSLLFILYLWTFQAFFFLFLCLKIKQKFYILDAYALCLIGLAFAALVSTKILTCPEAWVPLFVSVYVIAWQGSAPIRLCEGLNVIHWAETVLLPASLPFCLTPSPRLHSTKGGLSHKRSLFIMRGAEVLHVTDRRRLMFGGDAGEEIPFPVCGNGGKQCRSATGYPGRSV